MEAKLLNQRNELVERKWSEARNSGVALMSTIIGLSSAALYVTEKRDLLFILNIAYVVSIFFAIFQELSHYRGSMISADLREAILFYDLQEEEGPEGVIMSGISPMIEEKKLHFRRADRLCTYTVYTFLLAVMMNLIVLALD